MKILSFDTCLSCGSVCLVEGEEILYACKWCMPRLHVSLLVPKIKEALGIAGWKIDDVELLVVTSGPGSFTGVRVGISAAKAMRICGLNVGSVSTLEAIAYPFLGFPSVVPVVNAMRGKIYAGCFVNGRWAMEPCDLTPQELVKKVLSVCAGDCLFCGVVPQEIARELGSYGSYVSVSANIVSAGAAFYAARFGYSELLMPFYIRKHDARRPNSGAGKLGD